MEIETAKMIADLNRKIGLTVKVQYDITDSNGSIVVTWPSDDGATYKEYLSDEEELTTLLKRLGGN
jgi:hypothetical protein